MGLFSRKKNNFDPRTAYVPEVTYEDDLQTTLIKATGIGSRDVKKIQLSYENDVIAYTFDSGFLKCVESKEEPLDLFQRFYWVDENEYDKEILEKIAEIAYTNEIPALVHEVKSQYPKYETLLNDILYNYSVSILAKKSQDKITDLAMDILLGDAERITRDLEYINIESHTINSFVRDFLNNETKQIEAVTGSTLRETVLKLSTKEFVPANDSEKIVYAAAESNSTLQDVLSLSQGFIFSDLLLRINELSFENMITIVDPSRETIIPEDDALPVELEDLDSNFSDTTEPKVEDEIVLDSFSSEEDKDDLPGAAFAHPEETAEEDWDYSYPPKNDVHDDGDFEYEEFEEDTKSTAHILDEFDENIKKAMGYNNSSKETIKELSELLRQNNALESETKIIDEEINIVQKRYDETFHHFQYTAVDKTFNENETITDEALEEIRVRSNTVFEELYELESERSEVGKERKVILKKIKTIVSLFHTGNVQELVHKIDLKIEAIDNVINKALHTAKDDEELAEAAAIQPVQVETYDIHQTPLFHKIARDLGNPFDIQLG